MLSVSVWKQAMMSSRIKKLPNYQLNQQQKIIKKH